jgi:hypothetical protein
VGNYYFEGMFQPIPKPLIPKLIKARVPVWLLVGALAVQAAANTMSQQDDPNCRINVQRVHQSTYSLEFQKLSEAKLKISTLCDVPQTYTSLTVEFEKVIPNKKNAVVKVFRNILARPKPERDNYVLIENLTVPCNGKGYAEYVGLAYGQVHLKGGGIENVSGQSDKPNLIKCQISAK